MQTQQAPRMTQPHRQKSIRARQAFTLIELLVVIIIIGILMGLLVPAIGGALKRARVTRIKVELTQLEQAVEDYRNKYGDYPPDFSDWTLTKRHFRKIFPKMSAADMWLLEQAVGITATGTSTGFTGLNIDRAEALVFVLGGYSDDPVNPLSGPGGPLELVLASAPAVLSSYQYNASRSNSLFEFTPTELSLTASPPYGSTDEGDLSMGTSADIFPVFKQSDLVAPYVYFDSRTYGYLPGVDNFNGYASGIVGNIRPYKSERANLSAAFGARSTAVNALDFMNAKTFQIISAGVGDNFGTIVGGSNDSSDPPPSYFVFPSGATFTADESATALTAMVSGSRYDETSVAPSNEHMDNLTNFSQGTLEDDLP